MYILILAFLGSMISNKQKVFKKTLEIASANVYIDFSFFQKCNFSLQKVFRIDFQWIGALLSVPHIATDEFLVEVLIDKLAVYPESKPILK